MVKLDSLMAARDSFLPKDEDDFLMPQTRDRLPSDTCMSSSDGMHGSNESLLPSLLYPEEQRNEASLNIDTDSLSDNLIDVASGVYKDTSILTLDEEENNQEKSAAPVKPDTAPTEDAEADTNENGTNHISNLLPVTVMPANNDSSSTVTFVDEDAELVSVAEADVDVNEQRPILVSREGRRK